MYTRNTALLDTRIYFSPKKSSERSNEFYHLPINPNNFIKKIIFTVFFNCFLLFGITYSQYTGALVPDFKVNDDLTTFDNLGGSIGMDGQGNFVIAWSDYRNLGNRSQIYCQRYNANAQPIGVNFHVGNDTSRGVHIAVLRDSRFIVTWGEEVDAENIYFQRFFADGQPNGVIKVINDTSVYRRGGVNIGCDSIGNFVCVWTDSRNGLLNGDIYAQLFDSSGSKKGNNFRVNDDTTTQNQSSPSLTVNMDGSFVVCWADPRSLIINKSDIYMQRYDRNGNPLGTNQLVNDNTNNVLMGGAQVASNSSGRFFVTWRDWRNEPVIPNGEVYFQIYDSLGNKAGPNKRADEPTNQLKNGVRCAIKEDNKFIIMWLDWRQGYPIIYAQRLDSVGSKIGNNFIIPVSINYTDSYINEVKIYGDRVHSVWNDNRNGDYDVWCNVRSFQNPDSVIGIRKIGNGVPSEFKLYQNYPNPFNPSTKIKFSIASGNQRAVKLIVYDILGEEVAALVNQNLKPGEYEVSWNASEIPSGVYFYRLVTQDFTSTKKMMLVK